MALRIIMRSINLVTVLLLFSAACVSIAAQRANDVPFSELDKQVRNEQGGWSGNKERLSGFFNEERKRLGVRFEDELLRYIAGDAEKHYWISSFLEEPSYLHGNDPLPYLSLLVKQQGIALLRGKTDEDSLGLTMGLNVTAAVLAERLGFSELAVTYKNDAERLLTTNSALSGYFPAMSEEERKAYERIKSNVKGKVVSPLTDEEQEAEPKAQVSAGILNGRAINKPLPVYPPEAREATGTVTVRVVFDESGKVIWAKAISGQQLLRAAAEDAARRTTFGPVMLSGQPVKVSGILLYKFNH
jgi:TonB family protein